MVETENTPNPDTLKFLPGKKVSEIGPVEFLKDDKSIKIPLANKILALDGIVMVFFGEDFITVKKGKNLNWEDLKHGIISEINDYYSKGNTAVLKKDLNQSSVKKSQTGQSNEIINKMEVASVLKEFGGKNFSTFKSKLSESIIEKICPIGNEINKLLKDKHYLDKILEKGAKRANLIAKNNLKEIYDIIGLTKFS